MISLSGVDPEKQDVCMMSIRMLSDMIKGDTLLLSVYMSLQSTVSSQDALQDVFCACVFSLSRLKNVIYGMNIRHGGLLTCVHLDKWNTVGPLEYIHRTTYYK